MMQPSQVRKAFAKLGLGMSAMSRLFQTGRTTVYRWQDDGTDGCNAILLRLLASGKITIQDVEQCHD